MGPTAYEERDYTFGQAILDLRIKIGLTQAGLANELGISRRAVGEWETGSSYPKAHHLKALITLGVQRRAFTEGSAAEEIRALWNVARQRVILDQWWLSSLLEAAHLLPTPIVGTGLVPVRGLAPVRETVPSPSSPRVDWGDTLTALPFYGREDEQVLLSQWIVQDRCHVVGILGMGGIGKSALAVNIMYQQAEHFEFVVFRSLRNAPSCEALLDEYLQVLAPQSQDFPLSINLEQRISLLLSLLRTYRVLLVLDNLESLLEPRVSRSHFRPGFEGYGQLLRQVGETSHRSCLLFTSREKPTELRLLEGRSSQTHSLRLTGLGLAACKELFLEKEVAGTLPEQEGLIKAYAGNPLALKIVTETIVDLFGGEIGPFLGSGTVIFGSINDLLANHFARLSPLEQHVLCWLAIMREPVTLNELLELLISPLPPRQMLLEAVDALHRRSLIERGQRPGSFTLQSVVLEYVTLLLITEGGREIRERRLDRLIQYGLCQAHAKEYVRQTQERLLVSPLLIELQTIYSRQATVEAQLLSLFGDLRKQSDDAQGYGSTNMIVLLRALRGHLKSLDLSHFCIQGAYLQGIEMQDTSLIGATLRNTVFTEAFDVIRPVAVSHDGKLWAAGTLRGDVRVWREEGQCLHRVWQAHTDITAVLAFSPDGSVLATGSYDGTVKLWDVESAALLWVGWHTDIVGDIAFAPDGRTLASCGADAVVMLWDVASGTCLQTLSSSASGLFALAWSPDGSLLASGGFDGNIRLWHLQSTPSAPSVTILTGHTNWILSLAFAPDGTQLASGSWDRTVKLWEVESSRLLQTLTGHTERAYAVAWSRDGRWVASGGFDKTIRLWDVEQGSYRATLHGHTAFVYSVAFTPDCRSLLSGSEDGTVRVWDVTSGQCVRIVEGYAVFLQDVAWSPDSKQLASAGTDTLVTIWDVTGGAQPIVLRGHRWHLFGVVWSPDGKLVASSGRDNAIRLWDPVAGTCLQVLHDPDYVDTMFYGVAWSPDGRYLASGSYLRGVQVWDMVTRTRCWVGLHPTRIRRVDWSPDSTRLAGCGDDGLVYLWNASDGKLLAKLQGHSGIVMSVHWSPDGTCLASGGGGKDGGELFVWDVAHHGVDSEAVSVQTLKGLVGSVFAVAWSPTGDVLVSGGSDGVMRWWEVQSGKCLRACEGHKGGVWSLKVSPDGRSLASSGNDGAIRVWNLASGEQVRILRHDRPYERLNITDIQGLNEAQKASLRALGAIENAGS